MRAVHCQCFNVARQAHVSILRSLLSVMYRLHRTDESIGTCEHPFTFASIQHFEALAQCSPFSLLYSWPHTSLVCITPVLYTGFQCS